jgi:hypothetical protein
MVIFDVANPLTKYFEVIVSLPRAVISNASIAICSFCLVFYLRLLIVLNHNCTRREMFLWVS